MANPLSNCSHEFLFCPEHLHCEYIPVTKSLPCSGRFICVIEGKEYFGKVVNKVSESYFRMYNEVIYNPSRDYDKYSFDGVGWIKPKSMPDPTHWYPIPDAPK